MKTVAVSRMRLLAHLLVGLGLAALARAAPAVTPGDVPWDTSASPNVAGAMWTHDAIAAFLASVTPDEPVAVGDFAFADLLGDGRLELVASVDYSGRNFFNTVVIVRRAGDAYSVQRLPALDVETLTGAIVDLNGDGKQELVLPEPLTPYLGAGEPQAKWTAIYSLSGALYVENTAAFAAYYTSNTLATLRGKLVRAEAANATAPLAIARIEYDKALRTLPLADPETGVATATTLAADADPRLRILGAAAAADIASPQAAAILRTLARDPDPDVASYAGSASDKARVAHCDRVDIDVLGGGAAPTVNLATTDPIYVAISGAAPRRGMYSPIVAASITFGETGIEQSPLRCTAAGRGEMVCAFAAAESNLQAGDGVARLRARRADGTCVTGEGAIQVIAR
jgi:hypothetical protein